MACNAEVRFTSVLYPRTQATSQFESFFLVRNSSSAFCAWGASSDQHFAECGAIETVRLAKDLRTGKLRGFGRVLFGGTEVSQLGSRLLCLSRSP